MSKVQVLMSPEEVYPQFHSLQAFSRPKLHSVDFQFFQ